MKVIEGEFRVLSEDGVPVKPKPTRMRRLGRLARRVPYIVWVWIFMVSFVGLTEGLW